MQRSKSFGYRPDPSFVEASLVEYVRRRVEHERGRLTGRTKSVLKTQPNRRSCSAPSRKLSVAPITLPKHKQKVEIKSCNEPLALKCPSCCKSLKVWITADDHDTTTKYIDKNYKRRSCPGDFGKLQQKPRSRDTHCKCKCKELPVTKDTVKYTISCGFSVKRTVETKPKTGINKDLKNRKVQSSVCPCESRKNRLQNNHSNCELRDCNCVRNKSGQINNSDEISKTKKDATPVRLRQKTQRQSFSRPRPWSLGALHSKSGGVLQAYQFDDAFNPVDNLQPDEKTEIEMKTSMSKKPVRIHLLNNDSVVLVFETKATVQQLFDQVCALLSIKEGQFFGLSTVVDNEKWFMDLKHRISRYAPKEWGKEIKRRASDLGVSASAVLTVQFQVQFFVEHPKLISDPIARNLYYLQVKKNVSRSRVLTQDEVLFTLASHALQSDFSDHNTTTHMKQYFRPEEYFPSWFIEKWGRDYLISHLPTLHAEHRGRTAFESQALYIQQASGIDDVPVHYYKLYKNKKETKPSVLLGIFHQGIRIHYGNPEKNNTLPWKLEFEFMWNKVGRLFFTGKRFEIYPEDLPASRRLTYYTGSHARSKYLLHFLSETHSLHMSLSAFAQHMRRVDGKKMKRRYRESYISGKNLSHDVSDNTSSEQRSTDNDDEIHKLEQEKEKSFQSYYQSTTSHGSSHTSGIESDSKQRTEEEDDGDEVDHYTDDFDPIELDHRKEFINITEDHLTAPPLTSLSVENLANPRLTHLKEKTLNKQDIKKTSKPSRDSTLTGEDFSMDVKAQKHLSIGSENRDDTLKNGVPIEVLMTAVKNSKTRPSKSCELDQPTKENSHHKRSKNVTDISTQTATPEKIIVAEDKTKLYYDDFHTIPRKPRNRSRTEDPKSISREGEHHQRQSRPHRNEKKHAKRSSSAHPPSAKNDLKQLFVWKPSNQPIQRTHSQDTSNSAYHLKSQERLKHCHGSSVNCIPTNLHLQGLNNDIGIKKRHSAFVPVTKPPRNHGSTDIGPGHYTVARGYDKYIYYDDVRSSAFNNGTFTLDSKHHSKAHNDRVRYDEKFRDISQGMVRYDNGRLSSFEDEDFPQKMSEACMRTLSAQRRKLSDSRFNHRMDSGRGSLRTTDDSSSCLDVPPHEPDSSPHTPSNKPHPHQLDLLRTPFIENYNEVIV